MNKRKCPLRVIVEHHVLISGGDKNENGFITPRIFGNKLDCGHVVRKTRDFYGEIHSEKQRCKTCYELDKQLDQ